MFKGAPRSFTVYGVRASVELPWFCTEEWGREEEKLSEYQQKSQHNKLGLSNKQERVGENIKRSLQLHQPGQEVPGEGAKPG